MKIRGVNQAALAEAIGASPASVSLWCSGKKHPSGDNLALLARELKVSEAWLQYGDGVAPAPDVRSQRSEYRKLLKWYWREAPPDLGRELGNAAGFAFEADLWTLARETGQNSLDELLEGERTVRLDYAVIELLGEELERFLAAIKFDDELRPRLEVAAAGTQKAAAVIRAGLDDLDANGRLLLTRISDYNATGLTGPEYDTGRFMAVCRNTLDSHKASDTAGGSYGLGKATMWASSWMGLVLTNSTLSIPEDGLRDNRFFARLELPWHEFDGRPWAGPAWLGQPDDEKGCTKSYGGNEALVRDLYVARESAEPGTTFLIVGAYDPSGAAETIDDFAESLRRALAENFWPAMVKRGEDGSAPLAVTVRTQRGSTRLSEHVVDPADFVAPMVETLRKHYDDEVVDKLDQPGDVVREEVTLRVPARRGEGGHGPIEHNVVVLVAQGDEPADGEPVDTSTLNRVVYLRGNNMIIRDYRMHNLPFGARPFHAIVLSGEAAGSEPDDRAAERFLRAAEPPAHNKWTSTPEVTSQYERGGKKALDDLEVAIRDAIRNAVRGVTRNVSDGPDSLRQLLRLLPPTGDNPKRPRVKSVRAQLRDDGAWHVEGTISIPPKTGRWQFVPVLKFGTESGPAYAVEWATLEAISGCEHRDSRLHTHANARTVGFRAVTDPASHPVSSTRARVMVDIRDVRQAVEVES